MLVLTYRVALDYFKSNSTNLEWAELDETTFRPDISFDNLSNINLEWADLSNANLTGDNQLNNHLEFSYGHRTGIISSKQTSANASN